MEAIPSVIKDLGLEYDVLMETIFGNYHIIKIIQIPLYQLVPHVRPDDAVMDGLYRTFTVQWNEIPFRIYY